MTELLTNIISWWTLLGFIFILATPIPKTRTKAWLVVILGGPASWLFTLLGWILKEPWKKSI